MAVKAYTKSQIELLVQHLSARRSGIITQLDRYSCLPREQREQQLAGQIAYSKQIIGWITGEIGRLEQMYAGLQSASKAKRPQPATAAHSGRTAGSHDSN